MRERGLGSAAWLIIVVAVALCRSAAAGVSVNGDEVTVDTTRYTARFTGALMTSLTNKLDADHEMIDAPSPSARQAILVRLASWGDDVWLFPSDVTSVAMDGSEAVVTYSSADPEATYRLRIGVDEGTEDLVLRVFVDCSGPLHLRYWDFHPEHGAGRLLLPLWGGAVLPSTIPPGMPYVWGRADCFIDVPALLYERNDHSGGFAFWVNSGDTRILFSYEVYESDGKRTVHTMQTGWNQPVTNDEGLEYRMNVYAGNSSHGVDLLKHRAFAPIDNQAPAWMDDIRFVYNIGALRYPWVVVTVADVSALMERANETFPNAIPLRPQNVLLYHGDWSSDGHDRNYPDYATNPIAGWYSAPTPYQVFMSDAEAEGYPTMPHFNASQINRYQTDQEDNSIILGDHPVWLTYRDFIPQDWDYEGQTAISRGYDMDPLGPGSLSAIGLGTAPGLRNLLRDRILAVAAEVDADAAFLDTSTVSWDASDINPNNNPGTGSDWLGLQTLIGDLRAAGLAVGGEMSCWETVLAGQQLHQVYPSGYSGYLTDNYRYMSAISGCLLSDSVISFAHLAMPSPDVEPADYFRQYIAGFMQGALPTVRWTVVENWVEPESQYGHRGKLWANERALYALNHDVRFYTGVSDYWSDDSTLIVESVDGASTPRTEEWLVKTLVSDWYWIYGGRAPSEAEFLDSTADKHIGDGSLIAELEAIVARFQAEPTPPESVEPRGLALAKIYMCFPGYPLVDRTVRWTTATGQTVTGTVRDGETFSDVSLEHWAFFPIEACVEAGIVGGFGDGTYQPSATVTREQMAVYISRALAGGDAYVPTGPATATFADVPTDHWAYRHVEYAVSHEVVAGYGDGLYHPEAAVDRGQMAVYVARARGWVGVEDDMTTAPELFTDVPAGFWAGTAVQACVDNDVVSGYGDGYYRPEWTVGRDQMAVYVARAFQLPM